MNVLVLIACLISVLTALLVCWAAGGFLGLHWLWILPLTWLGAMAVCVLLAVAVLWLLCRRVDLSEQRQEDDPFMRRVMNLYVESALILLHTRVHVTGLEKLPKDGRYCVMCNHLYLFDCLILLRVLPESQLAFLAKKEVLRMPMIGQLLHATLGQAVDRENDRAAIVTIRRCIQLLQEDKVSLGIFPEGYCSLDGRLQPFRSGVFKIPQRAKVPVVVCTLRGTKDLLRNLCSPIPRHVYFDILDVLEPESFQGQTAAAIGDRAHAIMETKVE